jgi:hypothetical protein
MRMTAVCCFIVLLIKMSSAVSISGSVYDSASGFPVQGAKITFRTPAVSQMVFSDSTGYFHAEYSLEKPYPLQFFIEKTGYTLKRMEVLVNTDTIDVGRIPMDILVESTITFCGTVVDSVTGAPLGGVSMGLYRNTGSPPYLTYSTDSAGQFCQKVTLSNNFEGRAFWKTGLSGYYLAVGEITASMDSIRQTIRIRPFGSILIDVKGTVVDSQTRLPIGNAMVFMQTNYHSAQPDSSCVAPDGIFARPVQAGVSSSAIPALMYRITADGYADKTGYLPIQFEASVDLGEIALLKTGTAVLVIKSRQIRVPDRGNCRAFAVNGKLISKSPVGAESRKNQGLFASQVIIIVEETAVTKRPSVTGRAGGVNISAK